MTERDRDDRKRDRVYVAFGRIGTRHPALVSIVLALLTIAGIYFASQLTISTSRFGLVAEDNWYQQRILKFFEAFGYPDSPVAIVEGGTPEDRRETVERLSAALDDEPEFQGRVLARIDAEAIAETLLVQEPGGLADFRRQLPPDADLASALEGGLEGLFGLLEDQLYAALDGEIEADPKQADAQLAQLAALARALDQELAADAGDGEGADLDALLEAVAGDRAGAFPSEEDLAERGLDSEGYFVSNDGERLLVAIFPVFEGDEVEDYAPTVERLRTIRDELEPAGEARIVYTGLPFLVVDEEAALAVGLPRSSVGAGLGIFVLLMLAFRSLKRAAVALMPIAIGTVVSLGALFLLYRHLDPITSSFAAVLMGLAIDFPVHLLARYDEDLRHGRTRGEALFSALRKAGPGVVTGAVTTGLAFLTVATTEFTSYGVMGVITAIGLAVALLTALLCLPVMLGRGELDAQEEPQRPLPAVDLIPKLVRKGPAVVLLVAFSLALAGVAAIPDYNPRYLEFLPKGWESTQGLRALEEDGAMSPWFAWVTADDLDEARERAEALRAKPSVARVDSPTDLLPELDDERLARLEADFAGLERSPDWSKLEARKPDPRELAKQVRDVVDALDELSFAAEQVDRDPKAINDAKKAFKGLQTRLESVPVERGAATLDEIEDQMAEILGRAWTTAAAVAERGHWVPSDLPDKFENRFIARDGSERLAIYAYPEGDITKSGGDLGPSRRFTHDLEAVDPEAAGQGISLFRHNEMILHGFKRASFFSICLVLVLLLLDFASLRKALLALVPVLIGMGWMVGVYGIIGLRLNVATVVVMPLMLGIGIDAGVHMMHRWEINASHHHGVAKLDEVIHGTGGAVVLSSLTTMVGFGGLLLGKHLGMVQLGGAMVIGIGCTLLSSVIVLPALLLVLDKAE